MGGKNLLVPLIQGPCLGVPNRFDWKDLEIRNERKNQGGKSDIWEHSRADPTVKKAYKKASGQREKRSL